MFYWDSPYWYSQNNSEMSIRQSLVQFRGEDHDEELNLILQQLGVKLSLTECITYLFSSKRTLKPFLILNSLFLLVLLSGKFAIDYYSVEVFIHFGTNISESQASNISAILGLVGSLFLVFLVRFMKRKSLLILTTMMMMVALIMLGVCSYSHTHRIQLLSDCNWLPITCAVTYIMAANMGLSFLPVIFISEFYSHQVRCVWGGITLALSNLEMIIVTQLLPEAENKIPNYYLFWFFASVCVCIISFVCSYIPETKNRELSTIFSD